MGLFDRMFRLIQADINDFLLEVSDPEQILQSIVDKMQEDRVYVHKLLSEAIANQQRNKLSYYQAISQLNYWQEQVRLAHQVGDEDLLVRAIDYKRTYRDTVSLLKAGLDDKSSQIPKLQENLIQIDREIFDIRVRLNLLKERLQLVQTTEEIRHLKSILDSFSRLSISRGSGDLSNS